MNAGVRLFRARRLAGHIIHDPIDPFDLVDDSTRNLFQNVIGDTGPVGGHAIHRGDGSDADGVDVGAFIAHDAYDAVIAGIFKVFCDAGVATIIGDVFQVNRLRHSDGTGYDIKLVPP